MYAYDSPSHTIPLHFLLHKDKRFQSESPGVLGEGRHQHQGDIPLLPDAVQDIPPRHGGDQRVEETVQRLRVGEQSGQKDREPGAGEGEAGDVGGQG